MCLQGLNLLSTEDSAPNHDLALLQPVMNLVGCALHEVKHKHSWMNDFSISNIRMVFRKVKDLIA